MIKVAIIGYGGIARVHNSAYAALVEQGVDVKLVAVCDKNTDRIFEKLNFNLGALDNIYMHRHSVYPSWGGDSASHSIERSGGCAIDTHIHDLDICRFLFGEPTAVSAVSFINVPSYQAITTNLYFDGMTAIVDCFWDSSYRKSFSCGYRARFRDGVIDYDGTAVTVTKNGQAPMTLALSGDMTMGEIAYFLDCKRAKKEPSENHPLDSKRSSRLHMRRSTAPLSAERRSNLSFN